PIATARGTRYLHTKKIPLLDSNGRPRYLLGISEDITEKKIAEQQRAVRDNGPLRSASGCGMETCPGG
ncbi:MAG: hypothetical protein ACK5VV_11970, partial [Lysobacteraceae bacterium]